MNSLKSISNRNLWHQSKKRFKTSALLASEIKIPARIDRSPTDILRALEKTISRDPTAPHYKYHDDPYLAPMSRFHLRTYTLSREAGRKAAMWIFNEHGDLFPGDLSDPKIKAFSPPAMYKDKSDVSEELLLKYIQEGNAQCACQVYNLLEGDISLKTKQAFLELLCFFNSTEDSLQHFPEERWYTNPGIERSKYWRPLQEIDILFEYLKKQDTETAAAAYNTMILGLCKFRNTYRAQSLYQECKEKKLPLHLNTYNCLIELTPKLRNNHDNNHAIGRIKEYCREMAQRGIQPNVNTLNSILYAVSLMTPSMFTDSFARQVFAEFKRLNVQPSLASYYHVLHIFCSEDEESYPVFADVFNTLKGRVFDVKDKRDTFFFPFAMSLASDLYNDRNAADTVHEFLLTGDNYKFLTTESRESTYYRKYLLTVLRTSKNCKEFFEFYEKLVPSIYAAETDVMKQIVEHLESESSRVITEFLPRIWSDMVILNIVTNVPIAKRALQLMLNNCQLPPDSPVHDVFAKASWDFWIRTKDTRGQVKTSIQLDGTMLGTIAVLLLRGNHYDRMLEVITFGTKQFTFVTNAMDKKQVDEILQTSISRGDSLAAMAILEYCMKMELDDIHSMAARIFHSLPLTETEKAKLIDLVGEEVLQSASGDR